MSYDFAPLLRSAIGFDRLARMVDDAVSNAPAHVSYPPYNIEKSADDVYQVTMALAGFGPEDVEVFLAENQLIIKGTAPRKTTGGQLLHRGIATRAFERRFALADHIEVTGAELINGLLTVSVRQITPEALKPRRIPISSGPAQDGPTSEKTMNLEQNALMQQCMNADHAARLQVNN